MFVTNSLTYLPQVDQIVVLKDGTISETGGYQELISHNGPFAEFIATYLNDVEEDEGESDKICKLCERSSLPSKNFPCISMYMLQIGALVSLGRLVEACKIYF